MWLLTEKGPSPVPLKTNWTLTGQGTWARWKPTMNWGRLASDGGKRRPPPSDVICWHPLAASVPGALLARSCATEAPWCLPLPWHLL